MNHDSLRDNQLKNAITTFLSGCKSSVYLSAIEKNIDANQRLPYFSAREIEKAVQELVADRELIFKPAYDSDSFERGSFALGKPITRFVPDSTPIPNKSVVRPALKEVLDEPEIDPGMCQEIKAFVEDKDEVPVSDVKSHIQGVFGQKKYSHTEIERTVHALVDIGFLIFKQGGSKAFSAGIVHSCAQHKKEAENRRIRENGRDEQILINEANMFLQNSFLKGNDAGDVAQKSEILQYLSNARVFTSSWEPGASDLRLSLSSERAKVEELAAQDTAQVQSESGDRRTEYAIPKDYGELTDFIKKLLTIELGIFGLKKRLTRLYFDRELQIGSQLADVRKAKILEYEAAEQELDDANTGLDALCIAHRIKLSALRTPPKPCEESDNTRQKMQQVLEHLQETDAGFRNAAKFGEALLPDTFTLAASQIKADIYEREILPTVKKKAAAKRRCEAAFRNLTDFSQTTTPTAGMEFVEKEISYAESLLQMLIQERYNCYQNRTVYVKYRSIVPISMFYEYLVSERCYSLKGPSGCYNLYEEELRYKRITDNFEKIVEDPEKIKANQYHLYQPLCEIEEHLATLCKTMGSALASMEQTGESANLKTVKKAQERMAEYESARSAFYQKPESVVSELVREREEADNERKRKEEEERLACELKAKREQEEKEEKVRKRKQAAEEQKLQEEKQREAEEKQLKVQQQREEEDRIILAKKESLQVDSSKAIITKADLENIARAPVDVEEAQKIITNSLVNLSLMQKDQAPDNQRYLLFFVSETGSRISDERMMDAKAIGETARLAFELKSEGGFSPKQRYYLIVADFDNFSLLGKIEFKINIAFSNDFGF